MSSTDHDGNKTPERPGENKRKRPKYEQKFNEAWMEEFKPWLQKSAISKMKGFCTACNINLNIQGGRKDIIKHSSTKKHQDNCSVIKNQLTLQEFQKKRNVNSLQEKVKRSEIHIAAFARGTRHCI